MSAGSVYVCPPPQFYWVNWFEVLSPLCLSLLVAVLMPEIYQKWGRHDERDIECP